MPIYFIRHGKSEANERNQFAGRQDSPLTHLGKAQARQAGHAIVRKGLIFDEIHVSPLQRARFTAQKIAEISGNPAAPVHISEALVERHFGFLQGRNKSLWKKVLGYHQYDELLHSSRGAPQNGETSYEMYYRVRNYYEQVLRPASQSGKTILVVAHKYIVEMFALIVADLTPEDYCDFKIPNSRPSSEDDLRHLATHVPQSVNTLGELVEIHLPLLMLISAVLGVLLKLLIGWSLSPTLFTVEIVLCLLISTFFGLLYADPSRLTGFTGALKGMRRGLFIRVLLGVGLLILGPNILVQMLGLFFLLPPATLVPSLALLWGGDYAVAIRITLFLSALSLFLLGTLTVLSRTITFLNIHIFLPIQLSALLMLLIALILPAVVAQWYRSKHPIKAGSLSTNWGWLGGIASLPIAFLATYFFTPQSLGAQMLTPQGLLLLGSAFLLIAGAFGGLHLLARLVKVRNLEDETGRARRLAATTPNVFFWAAMISSSLAHNASSTSSMLVMWALLIFFGILVLQEQWLVRHVRERIMPALTKTNTIPNLLSLPNTHKQEVYAFEATPNVPESILNGRWTDIDRYLLRLPSTHKQEVYAFEATPNVAESILKGRWTDIDRYLLRPAKQRQKWRRKP